MREDTERHDDAAIIDIGAATQLTQGTFLPRATEAVVIQDHWDEP